MKEIDCEQYREILKVIDDDFEFEFALTQMLLSNMFDKTIKLEEMTVIDKFVICLQLKIHSYDTKLNLTHVCEKCESRTNFAIDLNTVIETLAESIDKSFESIFDFGRMRLVCDIPAIRLDEEFLFDKENYNQRLDHYLYSFLKVIYMDDKIVDLYSLPYEHRIAVCESLPYEVVYHIKANFIDPLHRIFQKLLIVQSKCSNDKCAEVLTMNFDTNNMTDVIRILFRDNSSVNFLAQIADVATNCHLDYAFFKNLSPAELNIIDHRMRQSHKSAEEEQKTNQDINMFDQYRMESAGMVESASEFQ